MAAGFKFRGEFIDTNGKTYWRDCVVAVSDKKAADPIGRERLDGARVMMSIALSSGDLANMGLKDGDISASCSPTTVWRVGRQQQPF
jgi:hypothetical protein